MDSQTQQATKLHRELLKNIAALRNEIQQLIRSSDNQVTRYQQDQEEGNKALQRILAARQDIQDRKTREQRTYDNLAFWIQVLLAVATWAAFIAAFIYAEIAAQQWR